MRLFLLPLLFTIILQETVSAQFATVNFDYEQARFGENQPLPAETNIVFTGPVSDEIGIVETRVYKYKGKDSRLPLATADWKRPADKNGPTTFHVQLNYKLNASKKYDVEFTYFRPINSQERQTLVDRLVQTINTYLDSQMEDKDNSITFDKSPKKITNEMNELAASILDEYRRRSDEPIPVFSELVRLKIEQLEAIKIKKAGEGEQEPAEARAAKMQKRSQLIGELQSLVAMEARAMAGYNLLIFADSRYVEDYQSEDKSGYFAINAGYGGVYLGGNLENLEYGTAPYLGLAFPLSTSTIAPRFLRNASITLGVFTNNFDDNEGKEISGPLVGRPFYVGLDYKLFQFIRFNAGGAILEEPEISDVPGQADTQRIFIQPFIGLSAKINLNISLDK